jgi:hypothetical protein
MVRMSQEEFLSALARMHTSSADGGSIVTTFKRYNEHKKGAKGGESSCVTFCAAAFPCHSIGCVGRVRACKWVRCHDGGPGVGLGWSLVGVRCTTGKSTENLCIVRASKGSKKIGTVVRAEDLAQFHTNYSNILKVRIRRAWCRPRPPRGAPRRRAASAQPRRRVALHVLKKSNPRRGAHVLSR